MNARSELYRLGGDGEELLAANVREVDEKIRSMIQLDANQFRQILMIPQGNSGSFSLRTVKIKKSFFKGFSILNYTELFKNN
ncbi:hypothetical protein ACPJHQ_12365 [Rossellomorea sp. H39__3]